MASRALRKAEEAAGKYNLPIADNNNSSNLNESLDDSLNSTEEVVENTKSKNLFELLNDDLSHEELENDIDSQNTPQTVPRPKKKKKNKKGKKKQSADAENVKEEENLDMLIQKFSEKDPKWQESPLTPDTLLPSEVDVFKIEYRFLNPDNELKRIFGSKLGFGGETLKSRHKGKHSFGGKMVQPKHNWPQPGKMGLSMKLVRTLANGANEFCIQHGAIYQQAQCLFWECVDSMNPDAFVGLLKEYPYHVDTLLQLAEVVRANEDFSMARDLVERSIHAYEASAHPLFNIAQTNCRLEYRIRENRSFFLALHRHMTMLHQRGCYRTALEFCKLIYTLDPQQDPLGMLLIIDFLAIKSRQYDYLMYLYEALEVSRNVSQLPSFAYSLPLGLFLQQKENGEDSDILKKADKLLQEAVLKFPTMLPALLDVCSVQADKQVEGCSIFGLMERNSDSAGLQQLITLYTARYESLWKDPVVIGWLERNVHAAIKSYDTDTKIKQFVQKWRNIRQKNYMRAPLNVLRHIVISDVKSAALALPVELRDTPIMQYDPLPPIDSIQAYDRPAKLERLGNDTFLSGLFRSILPNYNPETAIEEEGAVGGGGANLQESARNLVNAMRDLLNGMQLEPAPRDNNEQN